MAFLVGGVALTASNAAVLLFDEVPRETPPSTFIVDLKRTVREARPIASLVWVIACAAFLVSAESLFPVSAIERLKLGDEYAGFFASVTLAASGIGGALAGALGDKHGHARALVVSLVLQVAAFALAMRLFGLGQFYVALGIVGFASAAMQINLAGLTARLAPPGSGGAWMAIMRWLTQLVSALATALVAFGADRAGYALLFGACMIPVFFALFAVRVVIRRQ